MSCSTTHAAVESAMLKFFLQKYPASWAALGGIQQGCTRVPCLGVDVPGCIERVEDTSIHWSAVKAACVQN